ncbi:MAG: hypothetical protein MK081_05790 [Flavobacteriales bacterium]|nr:hypothetical protein [Flavobacteriales bacterium]
MPKRLLTPIFFFFVVSAFCQGYYDPGGEGWYENMAKQQLRQLKSGALLIRLPENEVAIQAAKDRGFMKRAESMQAELDAKNTELMRAFEESFTFCSGYVLPASDTKHVIAQQWDSIQYVNKELQEDPTIQFGGGSFLTAEITLLRADTASFEGDIVWRRNEDGELYETRTSNGGPDPGFEALIIKSDELVQLHDPFPYWVRTWSSLPWKRDINRVVEIMNEKLTMWYERWDLHPEHLDEKK